MLVGKSVCFNVEIWYILHLHTFIKHKVSSSVIQGCIHKTKILLTTVPTSISIPFIEYTYMYMVGGRILNMLPDGAFIQRCIYTPTYTFKTIYYIVM